MGMTLEPGPRLGGRRIVALVRTERHVALGPRGAGFSATKRPVALLIDGPGGVAAYAPTGTALDLPDLRRRYPALLATFEGSGGRSPPRTASPSADAPPGGGGH